MFRNYFKILLRTLQHNKLNTGINVMGMAVAFTCSIVIFVSVYFLYSFDKFHENKDRIYEAYYYQVGPNGQEYGTGMSYPTQQAVLNENTGIEKATLIRFAGNGIIYNEKELELEVKLVDNDFFEMFSFPIVDGNKTQPLSNIGDIVLTEKAAKMVFQKEEPVGKTIKVKVSNKWQTLVVSAVAKDVPPNSGLRFDALARTELHSNYTELKTNWDNQHSELFVMLGKKFSKKTVESNLRQVLAKHQVIDKELMKSEGYKADENGDYNSLRLYPFTDLHFSPELNKGGMKKSGLVIMTMIGVLILLIACFNFVNLNIGQSFNRSKEMGIRKCLGADKKQIWIQVFGESFMICLLALLVGVFGAIMLLKLINQEYGTPIQVSILYQPTFIAFLILLLIFVAFVAGGYPSTIVSSLRTTEVLKGKFGLKKSGLLRNSLVVAQFVIACVLICTTIIIYQQFNHLKDAPLGYDTSSIISVPIRDGKNSREIIHKLRMQLANQSSVVSISGTNANLGVGVDGNTSKSMIGFDYDGHMVRTKLLAADFDILNTMGIKPIAGRDFSASHVSDSSNVVIISQGLEKQLSTESLAGKEFRIDTGSAPYIITGVIPDFHLYSMREKEGPLMITLNRSETLGYALIKVKTQNPVITMDLIKEAYAKVEPGVLFKGSYVDENVERWYKNEKQMSRMFSIAAVIAIILSCMGLFGIALISIKQRVKEIGVRKVLGASVSGIASMMTRDFIKPVFIAILIAIPISWWAMNAWLQDFAYRIQINWWVFLLTAIVALLIAIFTVAFHAIKAAIVNPVDSLANE